LPARYAQRAVEFIRRSKDRPFFLYFAPNMPHVPLFAGDQFRGKSGGGLYGDVISEIDWAVGEIVRTLDELKLSENTLVIFTSDNGPWLSYGDHAGSSGPLREGKGTSWDGGIRVPCIMSWPGRIPEGTACNEPLMTIDLLPTIAGQARARTPQDRIVDGRDIWPILSNQRSAASPHEALYFYWGNELHAVRSGRWKLHLPHPYQSLEMAGAGGMLGKYVRKELELSLFDLAKDPGETTNLAAAQPDVVARLMQYVERAREDLGDSLTNRTGRNVRPPGRLR
jgi:arylsulfatase A-like enzyme